MNSVGVVLAFIARLVLRRVWRKTACDLRSAYECYGTNLRERTPSILIAAVIAAEDHRFCFHRGIDFLAIGRAAVRTTLYGEVQGASTIEQQLIRTVTRDYRRSLRRKIREIFLASLVESVIPKSDIPGVYLSIAYFGWRMNGVGQACRRLGFELSAITAHEAVALVARLKYPEPKTASLQRYEQIRRRSRHILGLIAAGAAGERRGVWANDETAYDL